METKDDIARRVYGYSYDKCCWREKERVNGMFIAEQEKDEKRKKEKSGKESDSK
jgi:hypothetical protein